MGTTAPIADAKRGDMWRSEPEVLTVIGVDFGDKEHPLFDRRAMKKITPLFVKSIANGIIENVICVLKDKMVVVVAGRRRVLAARLVNIERAKEGLAPMRVPYTLVTGSDADLVRIMNKENGQREQETPLGKGRKAIVSQRLGHTMEEIAEDANATTTAVGQWMKVLNDGAPEVIKAIDDGKIKFTAGYNIVIGTKDKEWSLEDQVVALRSLLEGRAESKPETEGSESSGEKPKTKKKGVTAREAKAAAKGEMALPGQRYLKKIVKLSEAGTLKAGVSPDVLKFLRYLTGGIPVERIPGMTAALREVGFIE